MAPRKDQPSIWEKAAKAAKRDGFVLTLPGDIPMFFRKIRRSKEGFLMGSRGYRMWEEPQHLVVLPQDFYLGTFVVTQEQYKAVALKCDDDELKGNPTPSYFKGDRHPVEQVSWNDATAFCTWVGKHCKLPKGEWHVRLPSEAEWEYACRAGSQTEYYNGDGEAALEEVGWFDKNSKNKTHAVDEREENHPFGLYGMHGNVWEWCLDFWRVGAYRERLDGVENPMSLSQGSSSRRVLRGGSWISSADGCRSAFRVGWDPDDRLGSLGFRVCLAPGPAVQQEQPATGDGAEPGPGDGGGGTEPESEGAGGAEVSDLSKYSLPSVARRKI